MDARLLLSVMMAMGPIGSPYMLDDRPISGFKKFDVGTELKAPPKPFKRWKGAIKKAKRR